MAAGCYETAIVVNTVEMLIYSMALTHALIF